MKKRQPLRQFCFLLMSCWVLSVQRVEAKCDDRFPENTPSRDFKIMQDGTAIHVNTGLIWARCSVGQTLQGNACIGVASKAAFAEAFELARLANESNFLSANNWHLPTVDELRSIVEAHCANPAINESVFPNTPSSWYWSASTFIEFPWYGIPVDFGNGNDEIWYKIKYEDSPFPVRLVRYAKPIEPLALGVDADEDGVNDTLEVEQGTNPKLKDNDIGRDDRFIMQLYRDLFLREAEAGEIAPQVQLLKSKPNRIERVLALAATPEFQKLRLDVAIMLPLAINNQISRREWLNEWRDGLHKGANVDLMVEAFMQRSKLKDAYMDANPSAYVKTLGAQILGRELTPQELAEGLARLQGMGRAAFTADWLTSLAYKHTSSSQVLVLCVANLLANYPLNTAGLSAFSTQLDGGKITLADLIQMVLDSDWYRHRFVVD